MEESISKEDLRVLWLATHPIPNNSFVHPVPWIASLAQNLVKRGVSLTVLATTKEAEKDVSYFDTGLYKLIVLKTPSGIMNALTFFGNRIRTLSRYLEGEVDKYDVVHVHGTEFQFATALRSKKFSKVPVVISIQGILSEYKKYISDRLTHRRLTWEIASTYEIQDIRAFQYFMCRTHWDTGTVLKHNPHAKIFQIWEVMRPEFYVDRPVARGHDILFSGGSNSVKGLERALVVFDRILQSKRKIFHVIGNCDWEFVQSVANKHKLINLNQSNVILHGLVTGNKILGLYERCYCLYHPTLIDNSPNSVCEAQLAGLPVVATNVGGVSSMIENGETGILLNTNWSEDYDALMLLDNNKELQERIAIKARNVAMIRHNPSTIVDQVIAAYNQVKISTLK